MKINLDYIKVTLSITVLVVLACGMYVSYRKWDFDDSYIVYRIVKNIINGHGWVYNIGESHNASTSVLNTVLIAAFSPLIGDIGLAAHIIGAVAVLATGLIAYRLFRDRFGNSIGFLAGYLLIRELATNCTWGLECNLFIAFLMLFVLLEERRKNSWPLLGVLILTRPDGILVVGLKWLKEFVTERRRSVWGLFTILIILTPWLIFSLYKFHQLFPDTFSQKIWQGYSGYWGSSPVYLKGLARYYFISSGLLLKASMVLALIGLFQMKRDRSTLLYAILFGLLQQLAYIIFNIPSYHWYLVLPDFLIQLSALYALGTFLNNAQKSHWARTLPAVCHLYRLIQQSPKALALSTPLLMLIPAALTLKSGLENPRRDQRSISYARITREIDENCGEGRLAAVEVGTVGFNTDRTIMDIAGLTSPRGQFVTTQRMDTFYSDPPELLLLHAPIWAHEAAIYTDHRFPLVYEHGVIVSDSHLPMQLYVLRDDFDLSNIDARLSEMHPACRLDPRINADTLKPLSEGCVKLDVINGQIARRNLFLVHQRPVLHFQGWALDLRRSQVPANVFVLFIHEDGRIYSLPAERYERDDVATKYKNPDFRMCGFQATGITTSLPPGIYSIRVAQQIESYYYYVQLKNRMQIIEPNSAMEEPSDDVQAR